MMVKQIQEYFYIPVVRLYVRRNRTPTTEENIYFYSRRMHFTLHGYVSYYKNRKQHYAWSPVTIRCSNVFIMHKISHWIAHLAIRAVKCKFIPKYLVYFYNILYSIKIWVYYKLYWVEVLGWYIIVGYWWLRFSDFSKKKKMSIKK